MRPYLARQAATGRAGVAPSGVAQECTRVFLATKHTGDNHGVWTAFTKADRPGTSQSARCRGSRRAAIPGVSGHPTMPTESLQRTAELIPD